MRPRFEGDRTGTLLWAVVILVPLAPSGRALAALLALSILSTGVAFVIYFRLIQRLGALGVASQAYLCAGVGVALSMLFLGETLQLGTALGIGAALFGVILINWPVAAPTRKH